MRSWPRLFRRLRGAEIRQIAAALALSTAACLAAGPTAAAGDDLSLARITHISGIAVDPDDPGALYIACGQGFFHADPTGQLERLSPDRPDIKGFAVHPTVRGAFIGSGHPADGGNLEVIVTADAGRTWNRLAEAAPSKVPVHFMAVSTLAPSTVYGTHGGLQVSHDAGRTWETRAAPKGALDIAASTARTGRVYLATGSGLFVTDDEGATWTVAFSGDKPRPATMVATVADGTVYAHIHGHGLVHRQDPDGPWSMVAPADGFDGALIHLALDPGNPQHLVAVTQFMKILTSRDAGRTWGPFGR
jgi:photosystem II stability/assembly factor-like uncharacterized protein